MQGLEAQIGGKAWRLQRGAFLAVLMGGSLAAGGCVSVNAPDKPIVIELNINIKQEVIYRLAADAGNTIDQNQDIF
ncbi:YnbE family lipoprotein [Novosphingobium kunmingense]|nr:YnbE family lipoprotein [Novosphingobium kunmingense]